MLTAPFFFRVRPWRTRLHFVHGRSLAGRTRRIDAAPEDRADDLNAAFADPLIRAVLATIGGEDQINVVPHLDPGLVRADPKPFCGYSDNTNLLCWLWTNGVAGFYGGSTQVHLGPGPAVDGSSGGVAGRLAHR